MVGFKAKICLRPDDSLRWSRNIDTLTVLDDNVMWNVGTIFNEDGPFEIGKTYNFSNAATSITALSLAVDSDFNKMNCIVASNYANGSYMKSLAGWTLKEYANANNRMMDGTIRNSDLLCIYLPTLKRFLVPSPGTGPGTASIDNVNDDGNMSITYNAESTRGGGFSFNTLNQGFRYLLCPKYDNPQSLLDASNYVVFGATINTSNYRSMIFSKPTGNQIGYFQNCVDALFQEFILNGGVPDYTPVHNPFKPVSPSTPTDPDIPPGTFDDDSDPIPDSSLPTLSAANTGFTRIYNPTLSQVQDLARYLWTDETVIETIWNHIKQFFEDPMEAIIGFNLVPVPVPDAGTKNFALMFIDTGVEMNVAANQFVDVDCGSVALQRYYGSALDQSPYTKVSCYLPFIGTVQLNTDEVMARTLSIKYRVDIVSGSCVAKIFVDGNCLYQYSGHCAIPIPFNSSDFSAYVSSAISVAKLAIGAVAGGAAGAGAAAAEDAEQQTSNTITKTTTTKDTERNPSTGRQVTTATHTRVETIERPAETSATQASFSGLSPQNISNTVGQIMGSKPQIQHSGSFSGNTGYLGVRRPFLIIERPNMCLPENYQTLNGYPAMITMELSTCKGYTRVQQVQLSGMTATNPEQAEILQLLKSGVVF